MFKTLSVNQPSPWQLPPPLPAQESTLSTLNTVEQTSTAWNRGPSGHSGTFSIAKPAGVCPSDDGSNEPGPSRTSTASAARTHPYRQSQLQQTTTQDRPWQAAQDEGTVTAKAPLPAVARVRKNKPVTADHLRHLRTWGEQGIAARGGLLNIAKELKVSYGTLASLISVSGQPTPVGLRKLGEAMIRPVTTEDLEQLWALGSDGVAALGGLPAIADRLGVSYGSLAQLAKPSGEPTEAGLRKLAHAKPKPVTIEILQHLRTLGQGGITRLGGLSAIARHLGVSYATLAQLIKPCGQPTQAGLLKLGETTVRRITVEDLRQLRTEGKDGIERRGGLSAIAVELGVNFNSLKVLIDANGRLTPIGLRKLRQTIAIPVTAAHVSQLRTWGEDGIASRGGLLAIADQFGVSYSTLRAMVDAQGRPTMAGLCKLGEARVRPLTVEDLRQVSALGQDGIKAQGGLSAVADKLQVSFIALRRLITVHGQPTKAGLSRLAAAAAKSASDELPAMRKVNR